LIEGHLHAELDLYADLPEGVLGLTQFLPRGVPKVLIDSTLPRLATPKIPPLG
jgi:hypothetical protein